MTDDDTTDTTTGTSIDSRDDIPDRDRLVELRRDNGLTNHDIAENWLTEFTSRQIGMFCSMYDIDKGWKDADYLQDQIDAGVTPAELAEGWPVTEATVRNWMDEFDIEENPVPDAYDEATDALAELAEAVDGTDDDLADKYARLANELDSDEQGIFA